jgi:hypothetical protein
MEMLADDYFTYLERQTEDSPLYLFDPHFVEHTPKLASDFSTPKVFPQPMRSAAERKHADANNNTESTVTDLFELLGSARPHFRWLIIGPKYSGSTFHVDPNGTSAWNACICGRKMWCVPYKAPLV